ncbi:hypothetical protein PBY51_022180 [Eleginops maclovinus]|uniref:Cytotoxic T-lymphocyte protein 4 n=1 Tax=Eleginops maclovinus TaxID=56733 RepID=A0AAN7XI70_ELEMC|nr:hypothetical protein PBY51_022180 [Eleginops maclovinus]
MALIVFIVLSLCLPVWSSVKVTQPYKVVSSDGTAKVQCFLQPEPFNHQGASSYNDLRYPFPEPEDLRVTLLKGLHGSTKLCSSMVNLTESRGTGEEGEVQCSAQKREGTLEVTLSGLRATDTDLYRCEIDIFYPPPYLRFTGNGTLIHVLGSADCPALAAQRQHSNQEDEGEEREDEEMADPVSVSVVVLVILVLFVLFLIMYFQASQCERGRREIIRPVPAVHHKMDAAAFSC